MTGLADDARAEVLRLWQAHPDPAHDVGHLDRVWRTCLLIMAETPVPDPEALHLAVLFHDVVNPPKDSADRSNASRLSAQVAVGWLRGRGWTDARCATVAHAIEAHSFSAGIPPGTAEARVLQDADRLEALGAIGLARMFAVAGALGRGLFDPADPMALHRPLDDSAFALDHLETKLFRLVDTMQTPMGRAIAAERAEWMASFRGRLLRELDGAAVPGF